MLQGPIAPRPPRAGVPAALIVLTLAATPALAQSDGRDETVRALPWTGGDRLAISVSADVRYVPGARPQVTLTGPREEVDQIEVNGGWIRYRPAGGWMWWHWRWPSHDRGGVQIVVTAPHLSAASLAGSGSLELGRLSQDHLDLSVSGSGRANASGDIRSVNVNIAGSGAAKLDGLNASQMRAAVTGSGWISASGSCRDLRLFLTGSGGADLGRLKAEDAQASITGSGSAQIAPRRVADLRITGSGVVRLATQPAELHAARFGSGQVIGPGGGSAAP